MDTAKSTTLTVSAKRLLSTDLRLTPLALESGFPPKLTLNAPYHPTLTAATLAKIAHNAWEEERTTTCSVRGARLHKLALMSQHLILPVKTESMAPVNQLVPKCKTVMVASPRLTAVGAMINVSKEILPMLNMLIVFSTMR